MGKIPEDTKLKLLTFLKSYGLAFSIMFMLFGVLLLPSSHVMVHDARLIDEITGSTKTSAYTPFVNDEFIFYWSPIDPLYDQADTEQNCPWGIENGHNDDFNNGQTDGETRRGISFYGDTYISDEGAISIGSYAKDNRIKVTVLNGHLFTDNFKKDYPENTIRWKDGSVFNADMNNNGKPDKNQPDKIDLMDPARAPLNSPDLLKVKDHVLWEGTLGKYEGKIFYTTMDWWLWDGVLKVESTGRVTVTKMTVTDGYIDKNENGIPDLWDDCDMDGNGGYNDGDDEVSHGVNTEWFANGMSDDAVWSFYGDEFFGFVHRDLMIASYDDNNKIEIIDVSDGDDTQTITLNAWENFVWASNFVVDTWCGGDDAGDNNELDYATHRNKLNWSNPEEVKEFMGSDLIKKAVDSGNFEADWVIVRSQKPVTIYGGIWDNNFHTQAYGFLGSRYLVPLSSALTITGLEREAHVTLEFQDKATEDVSIVIKPGEQYTYKSMAPGPFSNNYIAEITWCKIISDWPIRVEFWMANDDNAFDETQISTFKRGFDYSAAMEKWNLAIHHRCLVYIIALEDDTKVGWTGTWLNNRPSEATLDAYDVYRIVVDSNEDYNGDEVDDTEPDNQDELESVIQMMDVNADKKVMLMVRYARDYSCEPQDMDIVLSVKPTIQRSQGGENFWPLPLALTLIFGVEAVLVANGSKGLVGTLTYTGKDKLGALIKGK
ncbi:MAG: hypothetical protein QCI82_10565 [Candidatus Thermoplasmatota archaeon]|nr:hypothetical protein [Candidatus Thermoplasmatota archaeon]